MEESTTNLIVFWFDSDLLKQAKGACNETKSAYGMQKKKVQKDKINKYRFWFYLQYL